MIEAIKEIGEYALKRNNQDPENPIEVIVEDPASTPAYKHVLAILLNETENGFEYSGIQQEEYSKEKISKYLYRRGDANGADRTPTSRITDDIEKTYNVKTLRWFKNALEKKGLELNKVDLNFLVGLNSCLKKNKDVILSDLKDKIQNIDKKEKAIITLLINDGSQKYLGDIPLFRKLVVDDSIEKYYNKYNTQSKANDKICSVCGNKSSEVYGFVDTYKFYTVDKCGFVSGGFNQDCAWKNYPVCEKCAIHLESGKKYLAENLNYSFYKLDYFVIPKIFISNKSTEIYSILENFKKQTTGNNFKFKDDYGKLLSEDEDEILSILIDQENYFNINFLFYQEKQREFKILLFVEDVLPSRIRTLFDKKREVQRKVIFKNFDDNGNDLKFNLGNVRHFFTGNDELKPSNHFLEFVNCIFTDKKIDYHFVLQHIMVVIRSHFSNNHYFELRKSTFSGFQMLIYLQSLNLLANFNGGVILSEEKVNNSIFENSSSLSYKANNMFEDFPTFFDLPEKKAVFLEGALAQFLLNIQYQERGSTPFRTKLQGLKLDEKLVKRLLPEMQNKLEEYDKNYYHDLEKIISKFMIEAGDNWNITKDEISFYFVLGMNLYDFLKTEKPEVIE